MPKVDVTVEIVIRRPCDEVAAYAMDPDHVPVWYANIRSVEWQTPRPAALGSRIAFVAQFLGRRLAYTYEIVEFAPGERLVMRTTEGPFPMETSYTWQALDVLHDPPRNRQRLAAAETHSGGVTSFVGAVPPERACVGSDRLVADYRNQWNHLDEAPDVDRELATSFRTCHNNIDERTSCRRLVRQRGWGNAECSQCRKCYAMRETNDTAVHSEARRWAAELLELSLPADPGQVQTAFLKVLAEQDFAPDPDVAAAYAVLTKDGLEAGSEATPTALCWHTAVEQRLRRRIEQFLKTYFDQGTTQRAENWNELSDATEAFPALRQRLTRVRKGLTVQRPVATLIGPLPLRDLAAWIERHYVATPAEAARFRQSIWPTIREDRSAWAVAAHQLSLRNPAFVELSPELLTWVWEGADSFVRPDFPPPGTEVINEPDTTFQDAVRHHGMRPARLRSEDDPDEDEVREQQRWKRWTLSYLALVLGGTMAASLLRYIDDRQKASSNPSHSWHYSPGLDAELRRRELVRLKAREEMERKQFEVRARMFPDPIRHPALDASAEYVPADALKPANGSETVPQRPEPPPLDLRFLEEISKPARWPPTSSPLR
jgi:hypothetical protein